jgi:hypothetical protein
MELVTNKTADDLRRMCKSILNDVCDGILITEENKDEWVTDNNDLFVHGYVSEYEWISRNVYDERYVLKSDCELIEIQLMVAGGGPSIWVHLSHNSVEVHGYWGGDRVTVDARTQGGLGIWEHYEELAIFKRA